MIMLKIYQTQYQDLFKWIVDFIDDVKIPDNYTSCYYLSDIEEKYCDYNPVRTHSECFEAANFFNASMAICCNLSRHEGCERMSEGCKLQGCILDRKTVPEHPMVFWNHVGEQMSSDPKIRQICRGKEETPQKRKLDCNKSFFIRFLVPQNYCQTILLVLLKYIFDIQP